MRWDGIERLGNEDADPCPLSILVFPFPCHHIYCTIEWWVRDSF